ncbi:MAG: hypothetical protein J6B24_05210 [Clostridia bacterium]|nr:hypothetical protein [Clostridia bacterium]
MKKLIPMGVLLLCVAVALAACDADKPSETDTGDTAVTEEATLDGATEIPDTAPETEEPADTIPDETEAEGDAESDPPSEESTETETPPDETESATEAPTEPETEPEFTGPGKLVYTSNEGLRYLNNMGKEVGSAFEVGQYGGWKDRVITVGIGQVAVFMDWGWVAFDSKEYEFGYIVNGEEFFSESFAQEADAAVAAMAKKLGAKNCARFSSGLTAEALKPGENRVQFCVRLDEGVVSVIRDYTVKLTQEPVRLDGSYWSVPLDDWAISGHRPALVTKSDPTYGGMVAAGGVEKGALLHQGAIGVGTVDLSKYDKVVIYFGCDNGGTTQDRYNKNPHNRIMLTRVDTNGMMSPESKDIIASATYTLGGWGVKAIEIDLSRVNYKGPVYITIDSLPGTFVLFSSIEFLVE